jgi:hypothetical protein
MMPLLADLMGAARLLQSLSLILKSFVTQLWSVGRLVTERVELRPLRSLACESTKNFFDLALLATQGGIRATSKGVLRAGYKTVV